MRILQAALLLLIAAATAGFAASSSSYIVSPEQLSSGGATAESTGYSVRHILDGRTFGESSGTSYKTTLGFIYATVSYATAESGSSLASTAPTILNLKFDGKTIVNNDYVNNAVTVTALVSDTASGINTNTSSIEIDSVQTSFANLSGSSSFNAATGLLTWKSAAMLTETTHTFTIHARNNAGESTSQTATFKVGSGAVGAQTVLPYPNPFNPSTQQLEITYYLTKDSSVTIWIVNALGQPILKNDYASGSTGGTAGYNSVTWNGINAFGQRITNDVYFCKITPGGRVLGSCKIAVLQ